MASGDIDPRKDALAAAEDETRRLRDEIDFLRGPDHPARVEVGRLREELKTAQRDVARCEEENAALHAEVERLKAENADLIESNQGRYHMIKGLTKQFKDAERAVFEWRTGWFRQRRHREWALKEARYWLHTFRGHMDEKNQDLADLRKEIGKLKAELDEWFKDSMNQGRTMDGLRKQKDDARSESARLRAQQDRLVEALRLAKPILIAVRTKQEIPPTEEAWLSLNAALSQIPPEGRGQEVPNA